MPYKIAEKDGQFCVVKESGETVKCHSEKAKATAHLRALYANVQDSVFPQLSMSIVKANQDKNGVMRWRSVASDVDKDYYGEKMSKELFQDFVAHINNEDDIPEPFKSAICEEEWCGGVPYVSIAHFKSGAGRVNVPGEPVKIYTDGDVLKSTGILYDTPLGKAVFKSLQKDLVEKRDDKIRISIAFLDLEHSHGEKFTFVRKGLTDKCRLCKEGVGDKIYKKGHLVHLALTRVPANPRTDIEVEKSMTTKREDAESIIEDEEVVKGLDLKSQAEDILVVKSDEVEVEKIADKVEEPVAESSEVSPVTETPAPVYEQTPIEKSFAALTAKIASLKSEGLMGEDALSKIQPDFDAVGVVLKAEFTPPPDPKEVEKQNLETTLRSLLAEMLPALLAQSVAPIQAKLDTVEGELRAKSLTVPQKEKVETVQRSIPPTAVKKVIEQSMSQFDLIARQSVGLQ